MTHHNSGIPPARIDFGCGYWTPLLYTPSVLPACGLGHVTLALGNLSSGHLARVDVTDLAWLRCLASAAWTGIAEGVVEAGMSLAATP
jgi:hypothetical protein